ncbi:hypothetical protein BDV95DRAFT_582111 [Massariosphaeria phaeospora]|uniref:Uncharacterized protein n=1 Tax=Massariosphaeria phaeospora TaxID=100035 RepID=A0A7C8I3Z8_9PLEO|nr:hypothetical protein BDV95DRAFT_582111 [Massariosphaeria phaeospora]
MRISRSEFAWALLWTYILGFKIEVFWLGRRMYHCDMAMQTCIEAIEEQERCWFCKLTRRFGMLRRSWREQAQPRLLRGCKALGTLRNSLSCAVLVCSE